MKFSFVAQCFEKIEAESSRLEMTRLLAQLLKEATPEQASIICNLSLGQLHPPYVGTQFNIAQKNAIKAVAHLLHMSERDISDQVKMQGDIGLIVAQGAWQSPSHDLSVLDVYKALCEIEKIGGTGSQEAKLERLQELFHNLDQQSAKYVIRIVLGKLRLGFSDMTIIDALSWMEVGDKSIRKIIEDAYNVCADIGLIAQTIKQDGIEAIKNMHAKVGIPIRPAAAERLPTARAIIEKIGHCIAQPKLDGFRLQIHIDNTGKKPVVHFFSRNLQDMSYMFPDLVHELQNLPVDSLICEGEAICYDPNTGVFLPFQETVKRKRKHGIEKAIEEFPLKVYLFDLLYLNGHDLLDKTHAQRRKQLFTILENKKSDLVDIIGEVEINTVKDLEDYFNENIASGLEGLVVKRAHAKYQPGKRNFNWIKLKRQEEGHLEDTIDCVILGYYPGAGKRAAFGIGAFLVGVYNKNEDVFQTVAKVGTGLKDEEWKELKKKCDAIAVRAKPKNVECAKVLEPDVWISPEIVCMIRADEITLSPLHTADKTKTQLGYALRFPRLMDYRLDKGPLEVTTTKEIKRLFDNQFAQQKD